jgi:Lipocalin-like domain
MKKLVFGLISFTLLATACKKDKDAPAITKENITGTYKLITVTASVNGSPQLDADEREDCEKDDLYKLNADNSFNYVDAGIACDPAGDINATWQLNDKQISSEDYPQIDGTITSFDGTNMVVTLTGTYEGMPIVLRSTFKKQ